MFEWGNYIGVMHFALGKRARTGLRGIGMVFGVWSGKDYGRAARGDSQIPMLFLFESVYFLHVVIELLEQPFPYLLLGYTVLYYPETLLLLAYRPLHELESAEPRQW